MENQLEIQTTFNLVNYNGEKFDLANYDDLKRDLKNRLNKYNSLVVTEDAIVDAKSDRASLNKLKKMITDEKVRIKSAAFSTFEIQCKQLIELIDQASSNIDSQIKMYEQKKKDVKIMQLRDLWLSKSLSDTISYEMIHNDKWLNASFTTQNVSKAMDVIVENYEKEITIIKSYTKNQDEVEYAIPLYNKTLDLTSVIKKINERRDILDSVKNTTPVKEDEEVQSNQTIEETYVIGFTIEASARQIKSLSDYLRANKIKFKQISNDKVQEIINGGNK